MKSRTENRNFCLLIGIGSLLQLRLASNSGDSPTSVSQAAGIRGAGLADNIIF